MKITRNDILFWISLIFALWFAWMGMIWAYWGALFIAYPAGLISYFIWREIKKDGKKRNKIISVVLGIGLVLSLTMLIGLLITN